MAFIAHQQQLRNSANSGGMNPSSIREAQCSAIARSTSVISAGLIQLMDGGFYT